MRNYKIPIMKEFYKFLNENKPISLIVAFYRFNTAFSINHKEALAVYLDFRNDEIMDFLKYFEEL